MRVLGTALLLLASTLVGLGLAEVVLRSVVGPPVRWRHPQEVYQADPEMGHRLRPGQRAFTHSAPVAINSHGLRAAEVPRRPPDGTRRVLAIGDSQTFGNGLPLEQTWPKQLERELEARESGRRWQVLNAGIPGTDTWQQEHWLDRLAGLYDFDLVVVGAYVNDVVPRPADASRLAAPATGGWLRRASYPIRRTAVGTAAWRSLRRLRAGPDAAAGVERERRIITGTPDAINEKGWAQVERSLRRMRAIAASADAELLLLVIPRRDQVSGRLAGRAWNERLADIAGRLAIPRVDPLPALRAAYEEHGKDLFIPWDGHDSALANRVIARELAEPVARRLEASASRPEWQGSDPSPSPASGADAAW